MKKEESEEEEEVGAGERESGREGGIWKEGNRQPLPNHSLRTPPLSVCRVCAKRAESQCVCVRLKGVFVGIESQRIPASVTRVR